MQRQLVVTFALGLILIISVSVYVLFSPRLSAPYFPVSESEIITVHIPRHTWSFVPDHIEAMKGKSVRFLIANDDDIPHGFSIDAYSIHREIGAHATATTQVIELDKEGDFSFYCSLMCGEGLVTEGAHTGEQRGHFNMEGKFTVTSASVK
jgi:heme/copper-type cytochrome/quinol oxidase subunit 2